MQQNPTNASTMQGAPSPDLLRGRPIAEETVYRVVTVGAILLLLGSLWVF